MLSKFLYTVDEKTAPVRTLFLYAKSHRKYVILVVDDDLGIRRYLVRYIDQSTGSHCKSQDVSQVL